MASLNAAATEQNTASSQAKKTVSHFINVSVVTKDGTQVKLGAVPIFENPDKAQRTLLDFINKGGDPRTLDIMIDVRKNEPSTDTYDVDSWNIVDGRFKDENEE
jgi:hypothetical protein